MRPFAPRLFACLLLSACVGLQLSLLAQDTLYFTNGTMDIGRVVNQSPATISYKRASDPKGPTESARVTNLLALKLSASSGDRFVAFDKTRPRDGEPGQGTGAGREPIYLEDGKRFTMGGVPVTRREIALALANDGEAYREFQAGKGLRDFSYVVGGVGGFGLGYSLVRQIRLGSSTPPVNTLLLIGSVAVCTAAIVMESAGAKKVLRGIKLHNKNLRGVGHEFGVTPTGAGWVMTF